MIGLFLGDGPVLRRIAGEVVPATAGFLAGWMVGALFGIPGGAGAGLLVWLGLSWLLVLVRRRPLLRRIYRLALLAHVLFWSWQGLSAQRLRPPGPLEAPEVARWGGPRAFLAGVGEASFDLLERGTLAGWGQRPRRAGVPACLGLGPLGRASLDLMAARDAAGRARAPLLAAPTDVGESLGARALVLRPEGEGPPWIVVRLDLTTSDPWLSEAIHARLADLGVPAAMLLVTATHTHSGPGGYSRDRLAQVLALDHFDPEMFDRIVTSAVTAVRHAFTHARPARLGFAEARDRGPDGVPILARRRGGGPFDDVDDRVVGLRVEVDEGRTLALLLNHAVHPVAVRRDHMAYDRDLVGAVEEQLGWRIPGHPLVLFLNGALGDVAPRMVRSKAAPGALLEAGERFADAVAPALAEGPLFDRLDVRAARLHRDLGSARAVVALGDRGLHLERIPPEPFDGPLPGVLGDALLLPVNMAVWSVGFTDVRVTGSLAGSLGAQVSLDAGLSRTTQPVGAVLFSASSSSGPGAARLPLVWSPGEPSTAIGRAWRKAFALKDGPTPMVVGLAHGSMAYLTTAEEQRSSSYEAIATLYGAQSEALLTEALRSMMEALLR